MQKGGLAQRQTMRTIPVQIQASAILSMNIVDLQAFIETESMENPALSVEEGCRCPVCGFQSAGQSCPICKSAIKSSTDVPLDRMKEKDYLERAFNAIDKDSVFDPFGRIASSYDIKDYLKQQSRLSLSGRKLRIAEYLVDALDDDGYFREPLYDTAEMFAAAVPEIEEVLGVIQHFDPPGIAATNLRECLLIQLRAFGVNDEVEALAEQILVDYWEDFSKLKLKPIAAKIGTTINYIIEAAEFIREHLTPHPISLYRDPYDDLAPTKSNAVVPDIIITQNEDSLKAQVIDSQSGLIGIDQTYDELYKQMKSNNSKINEEDSHHIKEHVERVKTILDAIGLRRKTLSRVADFLIENQKDFIINGAEYLKPLRQKDIAFALEIHESTVCRALADKYCKLPSGEVISFEVFFDSALPIRNMISKLISSSSKQLSDSEIAKKLAEQGVEIARRTVAKYRDQLKLLPYQMRTLS